MRCRWCVRVGCVVLWWVSLLWSGCVDKVKRTCESAEDCKGSAPALYCLQLPNAVTKTCEAIECVPGDMELCSNAAQTAKTANTPPCRWGERFCGREGVWSACKGEVIPTAEICDRIDNDCDGQIDNIGNSACTCLVLGVQRPCYAGPLLAGQVEPVGVCRVGVQLCEVAEDGVYRWGNCLGQVLPSPEKCDGLDTDCDGKIDNPKDQKCECKAGEERLCYSGDARFAGVGVCQKGKQRCMENNEWSAVCEGEVLPAASEKCNTLDDDCDGVVDENCGCETVVCDGSCLTAWNQTHCGACGNACGGEEICLPLGERCVGAFCPSECRCATGRTLCGNRCVDVQVDPLNCGRCGVKCGEQQSCQEANCVLSCSEGKSSCDGRCVDLQNDVGYCGSCKARCGENQVCGQGICLCKEGFAVCGETCRDLQKDPKHCGACDTVCSTLEVCSAGQCVCRDGLARCGEACVNLRDDTRHCGACGVACRADQSCNGGKCVCKSLGPFTDTADCAGKCVNLSNNADHCGKCDRKCRGLIKACALGFCSL